MDKNSPLIRIWLPILGGLLLITVGIRFSLTPTQTASSAPVIAAVEGQPSTLPTLAPIVADGRPITRLPASRFVYPIQLQIETIGLVVPVAVVGLDAEGYVHTPEDKAGYWDATASLTDAGNTVIVGHSSTAPTRVFRDLGNAQIGATVSLFGSDGREYGYTISDVMVVQVAGADDTQIGRVNAAMEQTTPTAQLTLVGCYPADSCGQRIIVTALPQR